MTCTMGTDWDTRYSVVVMRCCANLGELPVVQDLVSGGGYEFSPPLVMSLHGTISIFESVWLACCPNKERGTKNFQLAAVNMEKSTNFSPKTCLTKTVFLRIRLQNCFTKCGFLVGHTSQVYRTCS